MLSQFINFLFQIILNGIADRRDRRAASHPSARKGGANRDSERDATVIADRILSRVEQLRRGKDAVAGPITLTAAQRARHVYLLGKTGSGKTVVLMTLFLADVQAGRAVVLIDARGDLVDRCLLRLAALHSPEVLAPRLVLLDFREHAPYRAPDEPIAGFNPLTECGNDPYTAAAFVMEVLRQQWGDAALGVQIQETLRHALIVLAANRETIVSLEPLLTVRPFRQALLKNVADPATRRFFERFEALGPAQAQWVNPVLNKVNWAARPSIRRVLGQGNGPSFRRLFETKPDLILLVCLGQDELFRAAAGTLGTLIVAAVKSAVMRSDRPLSQNTPAMLILDEAQHVAEAAPDLLSEIICEGRRFFLGLCVAHQSPSQIEHRKLKGVLRNVVGTAVCFGLGGGDADALAGELPSEEPKAVVRNLLVSQDVGDCLVVQQGQPFVRAHTRYVPDPAVPADRIAAVRRAALAHWGKPPADIDAELAAQERRYAAPTPPGTAEDHTPSVRDIEGPPPARARKRKGGEP